MVELEFDLTCTARLKLYDDEQQAQLMEAASGGRLLNKMLQNVAPKLTRERMKEGSF